MAKSEITIPIEIDCASVKAFLEQNDIVQVIRCKDCVSWDTSWKPTRAIEGEYWCSNNDIYTESDDYCSLGERKESCTQEQAQEHTAS